MKNENNNNLPDDNTKSKIDDFKKTLYSRSNKFTPYQRRKLKEKNFANKLHKNWDDVDKRFSQPREEMLYSLERKKTSIFTVLFIISMVFFIGAISYAFFYINYNKEEVAQEINMSVIGPNTINSGDVLDFNVKLENNTNWDFNDISVSVEFPKSTLDAKSKGPINTTIVKIDKPLYSGGVINKKFSIILSGIIGDRKDIKITTVYNTIGYSNTISNTKIYQIGIDSSPVSLEVEYPEKILSQRDFNIKVDVVSNTTINLNPLLLMVKMPQGFTATSFSVNPIFKNSSLAVFKTQAIPSGDKDTIEITGNLTGQQNEKKIFNFEIGDINPEKNEIRTTLAKTDKEIHIKKEDLQLDIAINNNPGSEYLANTGERLKFKFSIKNNLNSIISNLKLEATLIGNSYDKSSVFIDDGNYDSVSEIITWDKNTWENLKALNKLEKIDNKFSISIKELEELAGYIKNPNLKIHFKISGTNFDSQSSDGIVLSEFDMNIKTASYIQVDSGITFSTGPFTNKGQTPPVVSKETTYTAIWKVYNSTNLIEDVVVKAKLPYYVKFLNNVSPEKYYLTYEPETREISWHLKKIEPFIGYRTDPKTVYFQISLTPSANQTNEILDLIGPKTITATDTYIENQITASQSKSDTTKLELDPNANYLDWKVVSEK